MAKQKKIKVSDLFPDSENVNLGTERGRAMLERSLRQYGAGRSILLDKNRKIIAGNKTTEVAGEIGLEDVIVVETTGHELVAVVRTDLDLDKDPAARELAYADNRVAELDLSYDAEQVARDVAKGIDIGFFFSEGELNQIIDEINRVGEPPPEPDAIERLDKAEQIQLEWGTEPGQAAGRRFN